MGHVKKKTGFGFTNHMQFSLLSVVPVLRFQDTLAVVDGAQMSCPHEALVKLQIQKQNFIDYYLKPLNFRKICFIAKIARIFPC
jgi:hypothetical protein